jgi:hypothetical protein
VSDARACLVLHVGQHKTGSKALQAFLARNARALADAGVAYSVDEADARGVVAYARSHFRLFALLRREADENAAATGARDFIASLESERRRLAAPRVVVSAEDLFDMQTAHEMPFALEVVETAARRLAGLAASHGYQTRVVVYLRRQDHLLAAHYAQLVKGPSRSDLDFAEFARRFEPRLDSRRILGAWEAAFGRSAIVVRPYERERMEGGIVGDFFAHVLEMAVPPACVAVPEDVESVNRTPTRDVLEYIRALGRRRAAGLRVPPDEAVLEAALRLAPLPTTPRGADAWLSPAERRALLARQAEGNAAIARDFLGGADGQLFAEPLPEDAPWSEPPALSLERSRELERAIEEVLRARTPLGRVRRWLRL